MEYVNANKYASSKSMKEKEKEKEKNGSNKSKTMKLSTDPQSVAARQRRHRISDRFKILQSMVPGGTKMDTASMLEEAINYVKFLKAVIWFHLNIINFADPHHHYERDHSLAFGQLPGSFPSFPESINNLTAPVLVEQQDPVQALKDFNVFQGEELETLMHLDDGFVKY